MKTDIDKLIDNSTWSIKMYIGMLVFFLILQTIVGFLAPNEMKSQWILLFAAYFIEIVLITRLVKTEMKYKNKLIAIKNRIK
jgi:quinol-cytochrome oxidoreductase complex cytochrome b subunit